MTFGTAAQLGGQNVCAFLDAVAVSEIGAELLAASDNGYNVLVGSTLAHPTLFSDYSTHPDIYSKACNSDAAGRYQILNHWWAAYGPILHLPDFSPLSQDLYAVRQLKERGALLLLAAGDFSGAVAKCSNIWASLPGSTYGQHTNKLADLQAAYVAAGGTVVAT
jgi:muramidase (phage lysozyme)